MVINIIIIIIFGEILQRTHFNLGCVENSSLVVDQDGFHGPIQLSVKHALESSRSLFALHYVPRPHFTLSRPFSRHTWTDE